MPFRVSMRLPIAAFALACAAILLTLLSGLLLYQRMISASEKEHRDKYLVTAKLLVQSATLMEEHAPAGTFPKIIETLWRQAGVHPADEYICIVDTNGRLLRHTARPETLGNYCGDNHIFPAGAGQPGRLLQLVEQQVPYVGEYIASSGQRQIAAFVPIPSRKWTLGLHRSQAALQSEIEQELRPLRYGFLFVGGGLMPLAMLFVFLLFHRHNQQLRDSSEALRSFYMTADDVAIITTGSTGPDRKIIEFSPGAEHLLGYSRQEIIGQPIALLFPRGEAAKLKAVMADLLASKKGVRREFVMLRQDGQPLTTLCTVHPRHDAKGKIVGTWGVAVDISEQKEKEERLRLNEERFARLLKLTQMTELSQHELVRYALEEAVALTRSEVGYFHYFDETTQHIRLTAWSESVLHQCRTESEVHYPLAAAGLWADCVREGKAVIHNDYLGCPHKKGLPEGHFPLHRHMSVPVFEHGKIVAICGVGNKATAYNETDSQHLTLFLSTFVQILRQRQAVDELQGVRRTLDATLDSIYIFDPKTLHFTYVNRGAAEQLGYSREELLQMTPLDIKPQIHENAFREILASLMNGKQERIFLETEHQHKNGRRLPVEIAIQYVAEPTGQFVAVVREISQRKKMEGELLHAHKMEAIGTLAGGLAHDFNNILATIIGYTELALGDIHTDTHLATDLREVLVASNRARDLVNQILMFSRQTEERRDAVALHRVAGEAIRMLQNTLPENITIRQELDENCPAIRANPAQIQQILLNLCTNAGHAMEETTEGILTVRLGMERIATDAPPCAACGKQIPPGSYVRLDISDNGGGMDAETRRRVFDPFFTTKALGEATGLGLSVVHGIVRAHEGHITVASEPGEGTTFSVLLPPAGDTLAPWFDPTTEGEAPQGNGERILLVDDEEPLAEVLDKILTGLGYRVSRFTDPALAWAAFRRGPNKFDLILTDMTMPKLNGVELVQRVFTLRPGMPVLMATGFSAAINTEQAIAMGIRALLYKPLSKVALATAVREVLDVEATSLAAPDRHVASA